MTLRMVFDWTDLQRVRLAGAPDPMWELVLGLNRVRDRHVADRLTPWHEDALAACGDPGARSWQNILFTLVHYPGNFPDFLTPALPVAELGTGCEAILSTGRDRLLMDLAAVFAGDAAPCWVRELAKGGRNELGAVVDSVRAAYDTLVAPYWHVVGATVAADRLARTVVLGRDGIGSLLARIPGVRGWDGQVLEVGYPRSCTVRLAGRGLTLIPSYFCSGLPVTLIDAELSPVLVYPAAGNGPDVVDGGASPQLVALLGRTRAECLAALATPLTTSGLAERLGTSIGTASKQAAVLRDAGLASARRQGAAVLHHLTHLGEKLLTGVVDMRG